MLRDYQQAAVDAIIAHVTERTTPCCVSMATGAGKSHVIAALATMLGRVLVLQPTQELVAQNFAKYAAVADNATIYCAKLKIKDASGQVVFGSPQSVANNLEELGEFDAVIVDEAHRGIAQYAAIMAFFMARRFIHRIGLSATPYGMTGGYIYRITPGGAVLPDAQALKPFYSHCVYEVTAGWLTEQGWLTPTTLTPTGIEYDTNALVLSRGKYTEESVAETFLGRAGLTKRIVSDVMRRSANRRGVMIFAASVAHAQEIMGYLPPRRSRLVTGATPDAERKHAINAFRCGLILYLVNVAVLTTGFDVPHCDHIAIMRASESPSLWQQIAGRGLRLFPDKADCLISDYAGNIDRFFGDDLDLFSPAIRSRKASPHGDLSVECPVCLYQNTFAAVANPNKLGINGRGEFLDLVGDVVLIDGRPIPAHHGRRCQHRNDDMVQCSHRWTHKKCKRCQTECDQSARVCPECGYQLVDWNKQLALVAGNRTFVEDAHGYKRAKCINAHLTDFWKGSERLIRADFTVEGRKTALSKFYHPKDPAFQHFKARAVVALPAFVSWKAVTGKKYPNVKLIWDKET